MPPTLLLSLSFSVLHCFFRSFEANSNCLMSEASPTRADTTVSCTHSIWPLALCRSHSELEYLCSWQVTFHMQSVDWCHFSKPLWLVHSEKYKN